jgi:hypothetical protein
MHATLASVSNATYHPDHIVDAHIAIIAERSKVGLKSSSKFLKETILSTMIAVKYRDENIFFLFILNRKSKDVSYFWKVRPFFRAFTLKFLGLFHFVLACIQTDKQYEASRMFPPCWD